MAEIELFTSSTCPFCPGAKKVVRQVVRELNSKQQNSVKLEEFDTFTQEGYAKAVEYGIMAVPTIFVSSSGIKEKILIEGAPSRQELLEAIDLAEGRKKIESKKSFLEKLFG